MPDLPKAHAVCDDTVPTQGLVRGSDPWAATT